MAESFTENDHTSHDEGPTDGSRISGVVYSLHQLEATSLQRLVFAGIGLKMC